MVAIPTRYRGVRFRSRLEARWAALFDLLGWQWEYEPLDLNGYIPDFALRLHKPVLVEVKPLLWTGSDHETELLAEAMGKLELSGWEHEALIVGAALRNGDPHYGYEEWPSLGMLAERRWQHAANVITDPTDDESWWWASSFVFHCTNCNRLSFAHPGGGWQCRVAGCYDGDHYLGSPSDLPQGYWRLAGNEVQWRGALR